MLLLNGVGIFDAAATGRQFAPGQRLDLMQGGRSYPAPLWRGRRLCLAPWPLHQSNIAPGRNTPSAARR